MATAQTAQTAQQPLRQMPAVWEATVTKDKAGKKRPASTAPLENAEGRWDPSTNLPPGEEKRRNRWAMSPPTVSAAPPQGVDPDCRFTFGSSDVRLRLLPTQYRRLPFPAATATLLPYTCSCGFIHMKLQATNDVPNDAILLIGEASDWQGCPVQFDGSAHKRTQTGGAGVSLLQVTQEATTLVRWKSIPLVPCADNVIAEAKACLAAVLLAVEYHEQCLARGIPQKGIVLQGDILPLLNYLQGKGRVKRPEVVRILEECQNLLAGAPFIFRLVYLPRECNKLADYFAGQASAKAKVHFDQPLAVAAHRALPPYHLAQKLGFAIESGPLQPAPAFVRTECPATTTEGLAQIISRLKSQGNAIQDYLAVARSCEGTLTIGYRPSSGDGLGRFYTIGPAAQHLPRKVRLLFFGHNHSEIDISGAHYERDDAVPRLGLMARCLPFKPQGNGSRLY